MKSRDRNKTHYFTYRESSFSLNNIVLNLVITSYNSCKFIGNFAVISYIIGLDSRVFVHFRAYL